MGVFVFAFRAWIFRQLWQKTAANTWLRGLLSATSATVTYFSLVSTLWRVGKVLYLFGINAFPTGKIKCDNIYVESSDDTTVKKVPEYTPCHVTFLIHYLGVSSSRLDLVWCSSYCEMLWS